MSAAVANISPMNRSAFDGRLFTKEYHDFQGLWGEVSFAALAVLDYLRRYSHGYVGHGDSIKASVSDIVRAFSGKREKTTRPTIIKALDELRALHVISDDGEPGSTKVRTFTILHPSHWLIGESSPMEEGEGSTCKDSLQVADTCQSSLQVPEPTCQPSLQVVPPTCKDSLQPHPNKETGEKDTQTDRRVGARARAREAGRAGPAAITAPAQSKSGDVPEEWQRILDILHLVPRWEASDVSELSLLEDLCPIRVGQDYAPGRPPFTSVFVKQRATDFLDYTRKEDKRKPQDTGPRMLSSFRSWMGNQRNWQDWQKYLDNRQRGITAAVEAEKTRERSSAKRQRITLAANAPALHQSLVEQDKRERQLMAEQVRKGNER